MSKKSDRVLHARVSAVEPYAFTKVSALGVEEKRSNVTAQFVESPAPLGDGYRVSAHIVTFSGDDVLHAPASAIFPCGRRVCVFAIEGGRAWRCVSDGVRVTVRSRAGR